RQAVARRQPRLHAAARVAHRRGDERPHVGEPPDAGLVGDAQEAPVQVRVVLDREVPVAPDVERVPVDGRAEPLAAELDRELAHAASPVTQAFWGDAENRPSRSTMTSMQTCSPGLARSSTVVSSNASL